MDPTSTESPADAPPILLKNGTSVGIDDDPPALDSTGNVGADRVNAGQLAVFEDVARNPGASIGDITARTGLAQSLVSRIVHAAAAQDAVVVSADAHDRRRVCVELSASTRAAILQRADNSVERALAGRTPALSDDERVALLVHLAGAADLLARRHPDG